MCESSKNWVLRIGGVAGRDEGSTSVGSPPTLDAGDIIRDDACDLAEAVSLSMRALSIPRLTRRLWRVSTERPSNDDGGDVGRARFDERMEENEARRRSSEVSTTRDDTRAGMGDGR